MKTKISEDSEKIIYEFSNNGELKEVIYYKCCFIFTKNQQVNFDEIAENDLQNWIKSLN